jgi:polysaccharide pyruvyl transferase WcaK-like protein
MKAGPADSLILERDCGPRLLKSIIGRCDFLVGERTHSLIGSVSVGTPFVALTNRRDTRTHGIIGEMCRCEDCVVDMDLASEQDTARKVLSIFDARAEMQRSLERVRGELAEQIAAVVRLVKGLQGSTA